MTRKKVMEQYYTMLVVALLLIRDEREKVLDPLGDPSYPWIHESGGPSEARFVRQEDCREAQESRKEAAR
jgi:hypothetical protein